MPGIGQHINNDPRNKPNGVPSLDSNAFLGVNGNLALILSTIPAASDYTYQYDLTYVNRYNSGEMYFRCSTTPANMGLIVYFDTVDIHSFSIEFSSTGVKSYLQTRDSKLCNHVDITGNINIYIKSIYISGQYLNIVFHNNDAVDHTIGGTVLRRLHV